jgi:hypothetical protein
MSPIQAAVWAFLKERFAGKENAAPRATILTRFNILRHAPISNRDFRDTLSQLVIIYKKPICTTPAERVFRGENRGGKKRGAQLSGFGSDRGRRSPACAGRTDPLERQEKLF